jgi:hypothetical protein
MSWRQDSSEGVPSGEPVTSCIAMLNILLELLTSLSGRQDSNLRPPAPKAGALTGLRYAPNLKNQKRAKKYTYYSSIISTFFQKIEVQIYVLRF